MSKKEENEVIETNEEVLDENEELEATDKEKLEENETKEGQNKKAKSKSHKATKKKKSKGSKKKNSKEKDDEKEKKSLLKIIALVIVLLLVIGVGGFFGYKKFQSSQSVGSDWGDTYYDFILDSKTNDTKVAIKDNSKIEFIEVPEVKDPIMVVNYEKDSKNYSDIYYINSTEIKNIIALEPANIEMLYNIADKNYNWYLHTTTDEEEKYTTISSTIKTSNSKKNDTEKEEYVYKIGEEISVETVDGSKITMPKIDSEFVKVDVDIATIDYKKDLTEKELKESMTTNIEEFKTTKEITDKEIKEEVKEKEKEVAAKKEEMKKAEEEVAKKKEEEARIAEEERKRAEEEAKKGLKVGSQTLKYGRYVSDVNIMDSSMYGTIILKPNGQFHVKANCEGDYPYKALDNDGTYQVTRVQNSFSFFDGIKFTTNNGVTFSLEAHNGNELSDQWHRYQYAGSE